MRGRGDGAVRAAGAVTSPGYRFSQRDHAYAPGMGPAHSSVVWVGRGAWNQQSWGMAPAPQPLVRHLDESRPGGLLGLYLFGSSVVGGLRADSDVDLFAVTDRSLRPDERRDLVATLLRISGRRASVTPGRPLELTAVVHGDVVPWSYPPVCDFLYGEWLREEFEAGQLPQPHTNPDLAVLITTVHQHSEVLLGPDPQDLLPGVPGRDLRRALHDSVPSLLVDLVGDERNVLLTLARMLFTLQTDEIVSKDVAGRRIASELPEPGRSVLALAVADYLGEVSHDWSRRPEEARETAGLLASRIEKLGSS